LSRSALKDTRASTPMEIIMTGSPGDIYLIACSFRAALIQKAGARARTTCGSPGAAPSREMGARATGTRGGPGAAPSWEAGAGATGIRSSPGATPSREAGAEALGHAGTCARLAFCLDLELVRGGTRSSRYRQILKPGTDEKNERVRPPPPPPNLHFSRRRR
jgi:hypothetical protein